MEDEIKPYKENNVDGFFTRTFESSSNPEDLKWHRDYEDRLVEVLNENDWQYQEDNKLPVPLKGTLFIKKGVWHRVIKGTSQLVIKLKKFTDENEKPV